MLSISQLRESTSAGETDTVLVVFTDLYGRFVGKRFDANFFIDQVAENGTHACNYLLTVDMEMEPVPGYATANWDQGYGDFHLVPDLNTLRIASWLDRTAMVLCDVTHPNSHELVACAPRSVLRRQIERVSTAKMETKAGSELEYYIFDTSYRAAWESDFAEDSLQHAGWYIEDYHALQGTREEPFNADVRRHLSQSGVPVECTKGEWGKGQHELNIQYADILNMADNHAVYKPMPQRGC